MSCHYTWYPVGGTRWDQTNPRQLFGQAHAGREVFVLSGNFWLNCLEYAAFMHSNSENLDLKKLLDREVGLDFSLRNLGRSVVP